MRSKSWLFVFATFLFASSCGGTYSGPPANPPMPATQVPTSEPAAAAPTAIQPPTSEPAPIVPTATLPPMPDFEDVITFGGGGAGTFCPEDRMADDSQLEASRSELTACFWLRTLDPYAPFQISLVDLSGSWSDLVSPSLSIDWDNKVVRWEGYDTPDGTVNWTSDGALALYDISMWIPAYLPPAPWRLYIVQNGTAFHGFSADFQVRGWNEGYVAAMGSRPGTELLPTQMGFPGARFVTPSNIGSLDVIGGGFPANTPIYLLLYRGDESFVGSFDLMKVVRAISDSDGWIHAGFEGPFDPAGYAVLGISNPDAPRRAYPDTNDPMIDTSRLPYDWFIVAP